jgi:polysaccharide biosynthesis protein PslG
MSSPPQIMSARRLIPLLLLVFLLNGGSASTNAFQFVDFSIPQSVNFQAPAPAPSRALPLHRFPVSRQAQADPHAFFQMAFAIGDDYFDGRDSRARVRRHLRIARQVGAKYLRCAFSWNGIEPREGHYDFRFWDMLVAEASRSGIRIIPYVAYTPEWAARSPKNFWQQPPRDPALFARIMKQLASRYRGKILSWELWNEPDLAEYWQGTAAEFAALVKAGAVAVREGDPDAVIILGGMSHGPSPFFDELINQHHLDRWVDIIAYHGYPESWDEDRAETVFTDRTARMQQYITATGQPLDLWLNEMGYADYRYKTAKASAWGTNIYYRYEHTQRYAADFLFKSFAMTVASGDVSLAGWYRIDDFRHSDPRMPADKVHYHLGLIDAAGKPKPTYYALRFASRLLQQPIKAGAPLKPAVGLPGGVQSDAPNSLSIIHVFQRPDNHVIVTAWIRSSQYKEVPRHTGLESDPRRERVTIPLPCTASTVRTYNALGHQLSITAVRSTQLTNVTLTGSRVYIADVTCIPVQR